MSDHCMEETEKLRKTATQGASLPVRSNGTKTFILGCLTGELWQGRKGFVPAGLAISWRNHMSV